MWRSDDRDNNSLCRSKRSMFDYYIPLESIDGSFKDYTEYLKAMTTLCLDFISDLKNLLREPEIKRKEYLSSLYKKKFSKLKQLREKSEYESDEKYPITNFFDDLTEEEGKVLQLLFSINGVGIKTEKPYLIGEEVIASLNLLHDMKLEEARRILMVSSKLRERTYIGFLDKRDPELERAKVAISESAISQIIGCEEDRIKVLEEQDNKESPSSRRSKKDESILTKTGSPHSIDDVILPDNMRESIISVLNQYQQKEKFYDEWGMKEITGSKKGSSLLFSGQSGTGKSMMAQAIGNYLDSDVYYLPFDKLLNCWFGQTEKNIDKVFEKVNEEECVLIVDEAEGILNKRFSSKGAADSTENRITSIFLREMEKHQGLIIFTTNFSIEMDGALSRRFDLQIKFPMPNREARKAIWENHIPSSLPLADDVDIDRLARHYEITGGQIKNAVLYAGRMALMKSREEVCQDDFVEGVKSETGDAMEYSLHSEEDYDDRSVNIYG